MNITVKNNEIKLKKDYLTNAEVNFIISNVIDTYMNSEEQDIKGYPYNPVSMITNFYVLLFGLCLEDYDYDNNDDFNKYYELGVHNELLNIVTNAKEAYNLMISLSNKISSLEGILSGALDKVIKLIEEKLPDKKTLSSALKKMPKDWQKAFDEYNQITGKSDEKED